MRLWFERHVSAEDKNVDAGGIRMVFKAIG